LASQGHAGTVTGVHQDGFCLPFQDLQESYGQRLLEENVDQSDTARPKLCRAWCFDEDVKRNKKAALVPRYPLSLRGTSARCIRTDRLQNLNWEATAHHVHKCLLPPWFP